MFNKPKIFKSILFVLFLAIFSPAYASYKHPDVFRGDFSAPAQTKLNSQLPLTFTINPLIGLTDIKVKFFLPEGVKFSPGATQAKNLGAVSKGKGVNINTKVKITQEGNWRMRAYVEGINAKGFKESRSYYLMVYAKKGAAKISRKPIFSEERPVSTISPAVAKVTLSPRKKTLFKPFSAQDPITSVISVTGHCFYQAEDGSTEKLIRGALVKVYNQAGHEIAEPVYTDDCGYYRVSATLYGDATQGVIVKIFTEGPVARVADTEDNLYLAMTGSNLEYPYPDVHYELHVRPPVYTTDLAAWQAFDDIRDGYQCGINRLDFSRPRRVEVIFPVQPPMCCNGDTIFLVDKAVYSWDRIDVLHEYGHALMWTAYGDRWPVGYSGPPDHDVYTESNLGSALTEGWAEYFSCLPDNNPTALIDANGVYPDQNLETNQWFNIIDRGDFDGDIVEGSAASIFWDLTDGVNADDEDYLSGHSEEIMDSFVSRRPNDMYDFWAYELSHCSRRALFDAYFHYGINMDHLPPADASVLVNRGDTQTTSLVVTLTNLSATDDLSGVAAMRFSANSSSWSSEIPYAQALNNYDLSSDGGNSDAGIKTVYVQFKDAAGNWSESVCDTIYYAGDAADFQFSPAPAPQAQTITSGSSAEYTVFVKSQLGFDSEVNLSVEQVTPNFGDAAISCSFSQGSVIPGDPEASATLTVSTAAQAIPANYSILIRGQNEDNAKFCVVNLELVSGLPLGSISGTVFIQGTSSPLAHAAVQAVQQIGDYANYRDIIITASDGTFLIPELPQGNYSLRADCPGYGTALRTGISLQYGQGLTDQDLYLTNQPGWIYGIVKDGNNTPLIGIKVNTYIKETGGASYWLDRDVYSDLNGNYEITGLSPGNDYLLRTNTFSREGKDYSQKLFEDIAVFGSTGTNLDLVIDEAASVSGVVCDFESRQPLPNIRLTYDNQALSEVYSDTNGEFTLRFLSSGIGSLRVLTQGRVWKEKFIYLNAGQNMEAVELLVKKGALLSGYASGIPNLYLSLRGQGADLWRGKSTDAAGSFSGRLSAGRYFIGIDSPNWVALPQEIIVNSLIENKSISLPVLPISSAAAISGTINNAAGFAKTSNFMIAAFEAGKLNKDTLKSILPAGTCILEQAGGYELSLAPDADYDLYFGTEHREQGWVESVTLIDSRKGVSPGAASQDFDYGSCGATITGRVTYALEPLLMAHVYLCDLSNNPCGMASTDQNGVYRLYNVPAGNYLISASYADYGESREIRIDGVAENTIISRDLPITEFDSDADGIVDYLEAQTNPHLADSDGDGLNDGIEPIHGSNPCSHDSDSDGYEDGIEVLVLYSDPLSPISPATSFVDADSDGLPQQVDANDNNPDQDTDRYKDGYEVVILGQGAENDPLRRPGLGDVNSNLAVDNADSQLTLNYFGHLNPANFNPDNADVNRDGVVDNADSQLILNFFGHAADYLPIQ